MKSKIRCITFALFYFISTQVLAGGGKLEPRFQTGDFIFHMSQGRQAAAINEAQGSPYTHMGVLSFENGKWWVYEAVQPVKMTELATFIARGKNEHYVIKRIKKDVLDMSLPESREILRSELRKFMGFDYDIFFQWTDDTIYCSELAYKSLFRGFGLEVGVLQAVGELNLEGPTIKKLIEEREKLLGHPIDLNEPIITPLSLMNAEVLETIPQ